MKRCDMTMGNYTVLYNYYICGKPAKFKSPEKIFGRIYFLCGLHANSVNKTYIRKKSPLRCIPLTKEEQPK